ncbi:hypothetical protein C8R44DRAFT_873394 [Mycena epipterygia]|nr:hypothetical protein C8R44DRAFT_873394 [Mycena epipterygia]
MADTEFRASAREPTFVKPLDAASRRRSRASHDSAAASTRSWVLMNQQSPPPPAEPIPVPEPVSALAAPPTPTSRPLPEPPRRTSTVDEAGAEYMVIELPTTSEVGYQWTNGRGAKAREAHAPRESKGFVGGFVSGLRRLPRALVRARRPRRGTTATEGTDGTDGTRMTGNTLPQYVSTPSSPMVGDLPNVRFLRPGGLAAPTTQAAGQNAEEGRRPRHPSFRVVPPEDDMQQGIVASPIRRDSERGDGEARRPSVIEFPQTPMENPYDRDTASNHAIPPPAASSHPSRADDRLTAQADIDGDEPVSVHAHPLPTEDYRRMSAHNITHPHSRTTVTSGSFSTDSPSFSSELNGFHRFFNALHVLPWVATDRITTDYQPKTKSKTLVSWYYPKGATPDPDVVQHRRQTLDAAASPMPLRESPRNPPGHRAHRRATTSPDAPTPPTPYGYPFAYYPAFSPPATQGSRRPPSRGQASPRSPRSHQSQAHRHHRRSATYQGPAPWVPSPMLPAPPAPVYIIQATPPPSPPPGQGDSLGSAAATRHGPGVGQMLAPVYMQMRPTPGGNEVAFMQGPSGYAYAYSSPIAVPSPVQTP